MPDLYLNVKTREIGLEMEKSLEAYGKIIGRIEHMNLYMLKATTRKRNAKNVGKWQEGIKSSLSSDPNVISVREPYKMNLL